MRRLTTETGLIDDVVYGKVVLCALGMQGWVDSTVIWQGKYPVSLALPSLTYPGCRPCYLVTELWTPTDLVFFLAAAYSG